MCASWSLARCTTMARRMLSSKVIGKLPTLQHLHPVVQDFTSDLGRTQPCFALPTRDVRVLTQPKDFLALLLMMMRRARKRIFLSSLYIGSSEQFLIDALGESLRSNPGLHAHLLLDYNRSTRPGPSSTASLLVPLMKLYPDRVHINLFKSPKLKGLMAKAVPRRFDEGWGTWHAKIYGADDEVLISGANLNDSYFTNRQDRYLHFKSTSLSDYCFSFLQTMKDFCFRLSPGGENTYMVTWPDSMVHHEQIEAKAGSALRTFQARQLRHSQSAFADERTQKGENVLILPIIQAGQFGIREEERCLESLFRHLDNSCETNIPLVDLTSGYFGLSGSYQGLVLRSHVDCRILCASPKANGFYGSSGISGRIPEGYSLLEQRFWRGILRSKREWKDGHGVQLYEWEREGWTYHAKGLWISPSFKVSDDRKQVQLDDPILTLFGSTNLNSRSANLDTELAFVMAVPTTGDEAAHSLRRKLGDEVQGLRAHAMPWRGAERKIRLGTKALVGMVGGML